MTQFLKISDELIALDSIRNIRNRGNYCEIVTDSGTFFAETTFEGLIKALGERVVSPQTEE